MTRTSTSIVRGLPSRSILTVLEHAKQLRLEFERQLADLVEKERAAVGELEAAHLRGVRTGERAALTSEELALDQRARQRRAVDDHERPIAPAAATMNRPGQQFLAGAGLAEEQDRGVSVGHLLDTGHHVTKTVAVTDDHIAIGGRGAASPSGTGAGRSEGSRSGSRGRVASMAASGAHRGAPVNERRLSSE